MSIDWDAYHKKKECVKGKVRNPYTSRCVGVDGRTHKLVVKKLVGNGHHNEARFFERGFLLPFPKSADANRHKSAADQHKADANRHKSAADQHKADANRYKSAADGLRERIRVLEAQLAAAAARNTSGNWVNKVNFKGAAKTEQDFLDALRRSASPGNLNSLQRKLALHLHPDKHAQYGMPKPISNYMTSRLTGLQSIRNNYETAKARMATAEGRATNAEARLQQVEQSFANVENEYARRLAAVEQQAAKAMSNADNEYQKRIAEAVAKSQANMAEAMREMDEYKRQQNTNAITALHANLNDTRQKLRDLEGENQRILAQIGIVYPTDGGLARAVDRLLNDLSQQRYQPSFSPSPPWQQEHPREEAESESVQDKKRKKREYNNHQNQSRMKRHQTVDLGAAAREAAAKAKEELQRRKAYIQMRREARRIARRKAVSENQKKRAEADAIAQAIQEDMKRRKRAIGNLSNYNNGKDRKKTRLQTAEAAEKKSGTRREAGQLNRNAIIHGARTRGNARRAGL